MENNSDKEIMKQNNAPSPLEIILADYIEPMLPVTKDTASKLAQYFGTSSDFWLNLQSNFNASKNQIIGLKQRNRSHD